MSSEGLDKCEDYVLDKLSAQAGLVKQALKAHREGDMTAARLFKGSAELCAEQMNKFIQSMFDAEGEL